MQLGVMGLERMGANIAQRLLRNHHKCVVFRTEKVKQVISEEAAQPTPWMILSRSSINLVPSS